MKVNTMIDKLPVDNMKAIKEKAKIVETIEMLEKVIEKDNLYYFSEGKNSGLTCVDFDRVLSAFGDDLSKIDDLKTAIQTGLTLMNLHIELAARKEIDKLVKEIK